MQEKPLEVFPPNAAELLEIVLKNAREAFIGPRLTEALIGSVNHTGSFRSATTLVKSIFGDLGKSLGFEVAASGYQHADGGEWLYDMCWFLDDPLILLRMALVLETEMKPGGTVTNAIYVDPDFQKLVQAKADIRVWFCAIPNEEMVRLHVESCRRQIAGFAGTVPGDQYVLILYNWTSGLTSVEHIVSL